MKRGRPSASQLSVVTSNEIETVPRAKPPADLTKEQAGEWRALVERMPAEWFPPETYGVLAAYCRHVVTARRVSQLIAAAESGSELDVREYDLLLKMQEREGRAIAALATKMRLTQQSSIHHEKARKPTMTRKPWDDES